MSTEWKLQPHHSFSLLQGSWNRALQLKMQGHPATNSPELNFMVLEATVLCLSLHIIIPLLKLDLYHLTCTWSIQLPPTQPRFSNSLLFSIQKPGDEVIFCVLALVFLPLINPLVMGWVEWCSWGCVYAAQMVRCCFGACFGAGHFNCSEKLLSHSWQRYSHRPLQYNKKKLSHACLSNIVKYKVKCSQI